MEPVWGTLINYLGLRKINARGLAQVNKIVLMSATVYNLKKLLKFQNKKTNTKVVALRREPLAFVKAAACYFITSKWERVLYNKNFSFFYSHLA